MEFTKYLPSQQMSLMTTVAILTYISVYHAVKNQIESLESDSCPASNMFVANYLAAIMASVLTITAYFLTESYLNIRFFKQKSGPQADPGNLRRAAPAA